eukprot:TRINITY_DN20649_c0_g1_i1.p1 TRINITY_DN20649_c0_g1~~TRINITY_DN20649_c0_g1_i1.p1  ORF type:complete len:459 (+),score=85.82 TRINITY_DN20649_c0_g1_i1:207-1379(+)
MSCEEAFGSFWVLDGHGGEGCARTCAPELARTFSSSCANGQLPTNGFLEEQFARIDTEFFRTHTHNNPQDESGSTVVGATICKTADGNYNVKIVNAGDARGLLISSSSHEEPTLEASPAQGQVRAPPHAKNGGCGEALPVIMESTDHKPDSLVEKARIEAGGGFVSMMDQVPRINGNLAVSRGLGDFEYKGDPKLAPKDQVVSCHPDIYEIDGVPPGSICVLACDGIWDVMSSVEVATFVRGKLVSDPAADLGHIAADIIKQCLAKESRDNMTAMVIQLGNGEQWSCKSNRFNPSDEMLNFEVLMKGTISEEMRPKYMDFLQKCDFPLMPMPCSISGRWYSSMWKCPGTGKIYANKSCQKKGWKAHKESLAKKAKHEEATPDVTPRAVSS